MRLYLHHSVEVHYDFIREFTWKKKEGYHHETVPESLVYAFNIINGGTLAKENIIEWGMSPGDHCWNYYLGTLSCSQVPATHLNNGHL